MPPLLSVTSVFCILFFACGRADRSDAITRRDPSSVHDRKPEKSTDLHSHRYPLKPRERRRYRFLH